MNAGQKVTFHYSGKFEDGKVFDTSKDREPLTFEVGARQIIPGLEKEMIKMKKGEKKTITVKAEDAYGPVQPHLVQKIPKNVFNGQGELQVGGQVSLTHKSGKHTMTAVIAEIKDDLVTLNLNHPLAGKNLVFDVDIVDVA